ncbi:MAG TPA: circularly permuted type 2 ATP-grasp protein, partial [Candidatus Methylacidiphilales bacterium]|nr:circularly permuted type 2 ATP-grasp protein [Candidatus Methylacidiphilales bacterium]
AAAAVTLQVQNALSSLSHEKLDRVFSMAEELREEEGTYVAPREVTKERSGGGFDLMPLVIGGEEWARIEAGLNQRIRAWNLFLRDIYSGQEILKAGVVPYEIIYSDPNFHRGCARLPGVTASYLQLTAFDIQQNARGQWMVIEEHLGVADGASYALKKRQIMRQVMPRLFEGVEVMPIEDFAAQVLDVLQELVRIPDGDARSVLLAQGSSDEYYLDDAALARQMGVPIVQGNDLVVLDSRLYLKTIGGIEPVDVVLRRMATSLLDPVTFDPASRYGVPGLLSCVRKGALAVANGLGSDLANNRALAAYFNVITEYYLGEKPLLPSPHVYEMRDLDVREQVADNRDDYIVRHAWKRTPGHEWTLRDISPADWGTLWNQIEAAPSEYVAHKVPSQAAHPCWMPSGPRPLPVTLRAYALGMDRVSPCALAWTGEAASLANARSGTDRVKDVWILRTVPAAYVPVHAQAEEAPRRLRLTSRVAEAFFWMGRYAERAETCARMLRIVQMQAWPLGDSHAAKARRPLWAAMAAATGHSADFFIRPGRDSITLREVPYYFLLDRRNGGSVISCLNSCRMNAENIREHFPPEVWSVLNHLYLEVALYAEQSSSERVRMIMEDRTLHQDILTQLDELSGALYKHMLHNDAWHFWQLGGYAERGLQTLQTLKQVLAPEIDGKSVIGPVSSTNLDLILQMLAGQYAYRSLYHARPVAARVARLLLQDQEFPRSALFCVEHMKHELNATMGERPAKGADAPLRHCTKVISELNFVDMPTYFPPPGEGAAMDEDDLADLPTPEFPEKLEELVGLMLDFNMLISDHYLDHQVMFREPELFDLKNSY